MARHMTYSRCNSHCVLDQINSYTYCSYRTLNYYYKGSSCNDTYYMDNGMYRFVQNCLLILKTTSYFC